MSDLTNDLWRRVTGLEGRTLHTTARQEPFDVASVRPDGVLVRIHSSGKERLIPRTEIEAGAAYADRGGDLIPSALRQAGASEANPAYVAAILGEVGV